MVHNKIKKESTRIFFSYDRVYEYIIAHAIYCYKETYHFKGMKFL